jgi:hypothetical protein
MLLWLGNSFLLAADSPKRISEKELGGAERALACADTDKPVYRAGEKVLARVFVLNAFDRRPLLKEQVEGTVEIKGPKGDIVASGMTYSQNGTAGFQWVVPEGTPGGQYLLRVSFPYYGLPPAERAFEVRAYRAPRLKSQIVFLREGYGPGDKVTATLHTERAEGGIPNGAKVTISARVDGEEVFSGAGKIDGEGNCTTVFPLPRDIAVGDGSLGMTIEDGGIVETAAKTIPILLQDINIRFYPEGGELVEGLPGRVYVEARNFLQKPADFAANIQDEKGTVVAQFRTEHEGRGRFEITPKPGRHYSLVVTEPVGIKKTFPLPAIARDGVSLQALGERFAFKDAIRFRVSASRAGTYQVTISKREKEIDARKVTLKAGETKDVTTGPDSPLAGVLIATVWNEKNEPKAERLIFREPERSLKISITGAEKPAVPGGKVELTVKAVDQQGKPVSAFLGMTVTDDSVLEMIEKREQTPRLPQQALLETEVGELMDAAVYLDRNHPKADLGLDLLLGTQGWRRFILVNYQAFLEEHGDKARRALALRMATEREILRKNAMIDGDLAGGMVMDEAMAPGAVFDKAAAGDMEEARGIEPQAVPLPAGAPPMPEPELAKEMMMPSPPPPMNDLQQAMGKAAKKMNRDALFDEELRGPPMESDMVAIREFAFPHRPSRQPGERSDFSETVYWNAGVTTNEQGEAKVAFFLSDAITAFRVFAEGVDKDGALGADTVTVQSVEPFSLEPKIPLEVSAGDFIKLPIGVVNNHSEDFTGVNFVVKAEMPLEPSSLKRLDVPAGTRGRTILPVFIGSGSSEVDLILSATAGAFHDKVTRKIAIKPRGFPIEIAAGGMLSAGRNLAKTVRIPANLRAGSLSATAVVYPTPLGNLTEALRSLMVEPCGCFEQTSSTNYPLVMAQNYFVSHTGVPVDMINRTKDLLTKGYNRLTGFECKKGGYEWFGGDPANESLTAYGLLEFADMAPVHPVDAAMVKRTREWLMSRRDGKGGFLRDSKALDSFGAAPESTTNAYIVWALLAAGEKGLEKETAAVKKVALETADSYIQALAGNVLVMAGDVQGARAVMEKLAAAQDRTGEVKKAVTSITQSGGIALSIETTALAVLAWLKNPEFTANTESAMKFLTSSCSDGRFGSTQSTILALKAIVAYDAARAKPKAPGSVKVLVDGKPVGASVSFDAKTEGALVLPDFASGLAAGEHNIEVVMTDGSEMPASFLIRYYSDQPADAPQCKLKLTVSLKNPALKEGAITEALVEVTNTSPEAAPMSLAVIGLPGGMEPRHDQLKELVKSGKVAAYEVMGRNIVLYWRGLKPAEKVGLSLSLLAAIPGTYEGPASRVYQYYLDEFKMWVPGLKVEITPAS